MTLAPSNPQLTGEYQVLMRHYGRTQSRCDALLRAQASEIAWLQSQAMRLRAGIILRDTALAWEREQRAEALRISLQNMARERLEWQWREALERLESEKSEPAEDCAPEAAADGQQTEAVDGEMEAANLVICQTGCLSHGDYWRAQDQCRRTGKTCVLAEQSTAAPLAALPAAQPASAVEWGATPAS